MFVRRGRWQTARRRGVVLILVLSMLGLLAVIGVSFATFSGQARSGAIVFGEKLDQPQTDDFLVFGIEQLLNGTDDPMSALYGHDLKRDLYGRDAFTNGFHQFNPDGSRAQIIEARKVSPANVFPEEYLVTSNIPSYVGLNFINWTFILAPTVDPSTGRTIQGSQTFRVADFDLVTRGGVQVFRFDLIGGLGDPVVNSAILNTPRRAIDNTTGILEDDYFILDGRFRNAHNGAGMEALDHFTDVRLSNFNAPGNRRAAQFANFRINGTLFDQTLPLTLAPFDVDSLFDMDEDYDAADLENWFLALQSADGDVMLPSFHRPGIVAAEDWVYSEAQLRNPSGPLTDPTELARAIAGASKILRPRGVDHPDSGLGSLEPDPATGRIEYDVDNDGDGLSDSVWLDLGHKTITGSDGRRYKPLFSFMVVGLNGRLPLNTVGNLNQRFAGIDDPATAIDDTKVPLFDHASHLGYSPSEINPRFALQNASPLVVNQGAIARTLPDGQFDNSGVSVSLTQLRNLLTGTRLPNPNTYVDLNQNPQPGERNVVLVDGEAIPFPNNVVDAVFDAAGNFLPQRSDVLNASNGIDRFTAPVAGRWGEPDAIPTEMVGLVAPSVIDDATLIDARNPVDRGMNFSTVIVPQSGTTGAAVVPTPAAPGRSPFAQSQYLVDGIDDNSDAHDFFPSRTGITGPEVAGVGSTGLNLPSDLRDDLFFPILPSERMRRFVTPVDPTGNGRVYRFDSISDQVAGLPFDIGPDHRGRVGFFHYFRPPGIPLDTDLVNNNGVVRLIQNNGTEALPDYPLEESVHNLFHGYVSWWNPASAAGNSTHMAALPWNVTNDPGVTATPDNLYGDDPSSGTRRYFGTFTANSNSFASIPDQGSNTYPDEFGVYNQTLGNRFPYGGLLYNDPNEMNLYYPDDLDEPFGLQDLEWLYRRDDIDGSSLTSRLADLARISFVESPDSQKRRRLFSTGVWDWTQYSYAHDNPLDLLNRAGVPSNLGVFNPLAPAAPHINSRSPGNNTGTPFFRDFSVAANGRRINLNHPFPHNYSPQEPVRLKWISETYQQIKQILPPHAVDTPHELAKLGQYIVNIIDFRDPDNAITVWQNPDVGHQPARYDTANDVHLPPSIHLALRADGTNDPSFATAGPLVHYGMEYQPVAINEVLGFQFNYSDPDRAGEEDRNALATRLYVEVVNMLTQPGDDGSASNLDMEGWDFVLLREDAVVPMDSGGAELGIDEYPNFHPVYVRPDPITGQIPRTSGVVVPPMIPDDETGAPLTVDNDGDGVDNENLDQRTPVVLANGRAVDTSTFNRRRQSYNNKRLADPIEAINGPGGNNANDPSYHVFGGIKFEGGVPANLDDLQDGFPNEGDLETNFETNWDLIPDIAAENDRKSTNEGHYYWLYLRRPANPLAPPDARENLAVYNPMVVVDSIRFPISRSDGTGRSVDPSPDEEEPDDLFADDRQTPPSQSIYSIARSQPYRGGQIVPDPESPNNPLYIYGYSTQARPSTRQNNAEAFYKTTVDFDADDPIAPYNDDGVPTTVEIKETIGGRNRDVDGNPNEAWDYLVFNDRDFMSVAELALVPASPPGLFTKRFLELPVDDPAAAPPTPASTDSDPEPEQLGAFSMLPYNLDTVLDHDTDDLDENISGISDAYAHDQVRTYPYLADEFHYRSSYLFNPNAPLDPQLSDPDAIVDPGDLLGFGQPTPFKVGGPSSAGWHRMFEFFEVPSPVIGAVGPVAQGVNFDWYREARRPGLLNLNLIIDEEVFFGLLDEPRLLDAASVNPDSMIVNDAESPGIVTQVDLLGAPNAGFDMQTLANPTTKGFTTFTAIDPSTGLDTNQLAVDPSEFDFAWSYMKRSFSDFLKQRHGGSGYLFAYGDGPAGTPFDDGAGFVFPRPSRDLPYRSLSHWNINSTLMRPASIAPPNGDGTVDVTAPLYAPMAWKKASVMNPFLRDGEFYEPVPGDPSTFYLNPGLGLDPTVNRPPEIPSIPPRRLFQIPDNDESGNSNASINVTTGYDPVFDSNSLNQNPGIRPMSGFTAQSTNLFAGATAGSPLPASVSHLGGGDASSAAIEPEQDMRRHPYYRSELMQRLMNLTTVRTQQFAVWLTVGFFEVTEEEDRGSFIPATLGREVGTGTGTNRRFRMFYVVDRSRAIGYAPVNPSDYRDMILYSKRIE